MDTNAVYVDEGPRRVSQLCAREIPGFATELARRRLRLASSPGYFVPRRKLQTGELLMMPVSCKQGAV